MSLYTKALDCACKELSRANNRRMANAVLDTWKPAFKNDPRFIQAIRDKRKELNEKKAM